MEAEAHLQAQVKEYVEQPGSLMAFVCIVRSVILCAEIGINV